MPENKNDVNWNKIFTEFDILNRLNDAGTFEISSAEINRYRESRLMTKFDHTSNLPKLFKDNQLSILPVTRGSYKIGYFDAFCPIRYNSDIKPQKVVWPTEIKSINPENLYSEAAVLNCAFVAGIINDLMGEDALPTISGRMSTAKFDFNIKSKKGASEYRIDVADSQCEIDAGYESKHKLMLIEAKNYSSDDFLIRQLYYPYRLWKNKVDKEIVPVFLIFSNDAFDFFIYRFSELSSYNSIELVEQRRYFISKTKIEMSEISSIHSSVQTIDEPKVPFPQADTFPRIIDLLNLLRVSGLELEEIRSNYDFDIRQADYYVNALVYLGFVVKVQGEGKVICKITEEAKRILGMDFKRKYLSIVEAILRHNIFKLTIELYFRSGSMPNLEEIVKIMKSSEIYNVDKNSSTLERRAQTVLKWTEWIVSLTYQ